MWILFHASVDEVVGENLEDEVWYLSRHLFYVVYVQ